MLHSLSFLPKNRSFYRFYSGFLFSKNHEWVQIESNDSNIASIGISDHAQRSLGDLVYLELPKLGSKYHINSVLGIVESVKGATDVYSPLTGEIVKINENVAIKPSLINKFPMTDGWICKMKMSCKDDLKHLMSQEDYNKFCNEEVS